jgi:DNA-binding NarL/FixJ family response regulator
VRQPPRLMIVDREATRAGIRLTLGDAVSICGEAGDHDTAIRAAKREQPDMCVIGSGVAGGLAVARGVCRAAPRCAVVLLTEWPDVEELLEAVRAGAVGYDAGPLTAERLRSIVRAITVGEAVVPRSMVMELLMEVRNIGAGGGVSNRESQVLGLLRRGHSTAQIAQRLEIAPVTVRRHISELIHKLGVADRTDLVAVAHGAAAAAAQTRSVQRI